MSELAHVNLSWAEAQWVARGRKRWKSIARRYVSKGTTRNDDDDDDGRELLTCLEM